MSERNWLRALGVALASKDIQGKGTLRIQHTNCPVTVIDRAPDDPNPFDWLRSLAETARSARSAIISCSQTTN